MFVGIVDSVTSDQISQMKMELLEHMNVTKGNTSEETNMCVFKENIMIKQDKKRLF